MLPPLTDFLALLGIDLVLCAICLRLLSGVNGVVRSAKAATTFLFVVMWLPAGTAHLPLLAYVRGISSDLSVTLVILACLDLYRRLVGLHAIDQRESIAVNGAVVAAACLLYPFALGWGDWDPYRLGWGAPGLWAALLGISLFGWFKGLRLLPILVALALLGWVADVLESTNLWDYLLDPWLAGMAIFKSLKWAAFIVRKRWVPGSAAVS